MTPDEKARAAGIDLHDYKAPPNLAPASRVGNVIYTSGHVSQGFQGKVGREYTTEQGKQAARGLRRAPPGRGVPPPWRHPA